MTGWKELAVTVGGLGKMRPAPGTWGSLPPCLMVLILQGLDAGSLAINLVLAGLVIVSAVGCIALGRWAEHRYHGKDPGVVVLDETAGMALALLLVELTPVPTDDPLHRWLGSAIIIGSAFVLFRIFDIIKPQPANLMQQFPAGWGILLDDLVAAVYANVILQVFLRLGLPLLLTGSLSATG